MPLSCSCCPAEEAPKLKSQDKLNQQQQEQQQEQQQQQQDSDGYFKFLGLRISKDDLLTITLALAISYGIRW